MKPYYVKMAYENRTELRKYVGWLIEEIMKTFDPKNCRDLLDYFLKEKDGPNGHLFNRRAINAKVMELIFTGTDTTTNILHHALNLMSLYPDVQDKVYAEIDELYGTEEIICFGDRYRLPYTQATISEIHRFVCLVPLNTTNTNRGGKVMYECIINNSLLLEATVQTVLIYRTQHWLHTEAVFENVCV